MTKEDMITREAVTFIKPVNYNFERQTYY